MTMQHVRWLYDGLAEGNWHAPVRCQARGCDATAAPMGLTGMPTVQVIELKVSAAGNVTWAAAEEGQLSSSGGEAKQPKKVMKVAVPQWCGKWALGMDAYKEGVVGAKSKNIAGKPLRALRVPPGCAAAPAFRPRVSAGLLAYVRVLRWCEGVCCRL